MADLSSHPDFDLDVALSADLDGELDAYAAELGADPAELRATLDAPGAAARRAELDVVRRAVGEALSGSDELDDVTRRRLLAGAGVGTRAGRARPARDRSWMLRAGAAAAVTLVVVGALYAATRNSGDSGAKSSGSSAAGDSTEAAAVAGDLGDVGTISAAGVGRLLRGQAPAKTAPGLPSAPRDRTFTESGGNASKSAAGRASTTTVEPVAGTTVDACANQYATDGAIRFRASGAYQGRPAVVLGIDTDRRTIVFVVAADNCAQVLYSASR
jgi:hypothetical protein